MDKARYVTLETDEVMIGRKWGLNAVNRCLEACEMVVC